MGTLLAGSRGAAVDALRGAATTCPLRIAARSSSPRGGRASRPKAPPPMGADRPRSGQVGASRCDLTRTAAELVGRVRSARASPGIVLQCVPFRRRRALRAAIFRKPSDRGFLTRSDGGPRRAGHWHVPDRTGDFSPCLSRFAVRSREDFPPSGPDRPKPLLRTPTFRRPTHPGPSNTGRRTLPARPPLKAARSPAGRPSRAFR